jgi:YfiH family protein
MVPAPFYDWGEHFAVDLPGSRAVFTTRRGGFSTGPYASLNLGRLTDDAADAVEQNRARLAGQVARQLTFVRQVHGNHIEVACPENGGDGELPEADGQVVDDAGLAPVALSADCLPIALGSTQGAAMLHAGWRGLAGGVIAQGVRALRERTGAETIAAAVGPGAGPCCYEVDEQVHQRFAAFGALARRGQNLDLKAVALQQLTGAGVIAVYDIGLCTICAPPSLFFSHRRDHGVTGRQAGVVWRT